MVGTPSEGRCITASPLGGEVVSAGSESARPWSKPLGQRRELMLEQTGPQSRVSTRTVRDACKTGLRGRQKEGALSAVVSLVAVSQCARSAVPAVSITRFCTNVSGLGLPLRSLISSRRRSWSSYSCLRTAIQMPELAFETHSTLSYTLYDQSGGIPTLTKTVSRTARIGGHG
eukprot:IDg22056t1